MSTQKSPIVVPYILHNVALKTTENAKCLGITISHDSNWKPYIENIATKANNTLKFIKRYIQTQNQKIKETAYTTYFRPQLEYCSSVWHPWQKTLSYKIERVQRAAARHVNDYDLTSRNSQNTSLAYTRRKKTSKFTCHALQNKS